MCYCVNFDAMEVRRLFYYFITITNLSMTKKRLLNKTLRASKDYVQSLLLRKKPKNPSCKLSEFWSMRTQKLKCFKIRWCRVRDVL